MSRQWKYLQALKNGLLNNLQTMGHLGNQNKNATPTYFCLLLLLIAKSIYYTFFAMAKLLPKNHYCDKFCWSMEIEFSPGGENLLGERERAVWMIFFTPHWLLLMHREKQVKSSTSNQKSLPYYLRTHAGIVEGSKLSLYDAECSSYHGLWVRHTSTEY